MKRRGVLLLTASCLLLVLAACSTKSDQSTSSPEVETYVEDRSIEIVANDWDFDESKIKSYTFEGTYTGKVRDGVPNGQGRFEPTSSEHTWYYEGEFKNGLFNGQGGTYWDSGYDQIGKYTDGAYTPHYAELLKHLGKHGNLPFTASTSSLMYILGKSDFFPATTDESQQELAEAIDSTVSYPQMEKNISDVDEKIFSVSDAVVISISESVIFGEDLTIVHAMDDHYYSYMLYYKGRLPDIYKENHISFVGLPISMTSFSNVGGGTTKAVVVATATVTLIS